MATFLLQKLSLWGGGSLLIGKQNWIIKLSATFDHLCVCVCMSAQSYLTLCSPMDYSLPGSSVCGIFWAIILKWVAIPFSRASSQPRIEPMSLASPAFAVKSFTTELLGKPNTVHNLVNLGYLSMRSDCLSVMKCAHSKGNPHQTPGRQRENHLPSMLLLQRNIDIVV